MQEFLYISVKRSSAYDYLVEFSSESLCQLVSYSSYNLVFYIRHAH